MCSPSPGSAWTSGTDSAPSAPTPKGSSSHRRHADSGSWLRYPTRDSALRDRERAGRQTGLRRFPHSCAIFRMTTPFDDKHHMGMAPASSDVRPREHEGWRFSASSWQQTGAATSTPQSAQKRLTDHSVRVTQMWVNHPAQIMCVRLSRPEEWRKTPALEGIQKQEVDC